MGLQMAPPLARIDGWIRQLDNDRLEIFLRVQNVRGNQDRKIRASGPREEMYELVDWFETKTGLTVNVPDRKRTGPKPLPGQTALTMGELPSGEEGSQDGELSGVRG